MVGDRVRLVGDVSGDEGSLARIVEVEERRTVLRRTADDDDPVERVIVANADQLVVVAALADPEPRPRLIDRALVAAYDAGLEPLLCLTKPDLADPETLLAVYRPLGVPYVVTEKGGELADIRERLAGRISVLIGHSGVGKSTLVNGLVPGADRAIGVVNAVTGRGRHTSTSALMLRLPEPTPARRVDHRHPGDPVVRARARPAGAPDRGVPRPRRADRRLPARLHARGGGPECGLDEAVADGRTEQAGWTRSAGCSRAARRPRTTSPRSTDVVRPESRACPPSRAARGSAPDGAGPRVADPHHQHEDGDRTQHEQHRQHPLQGRHPAALRAPAAGQRARAPSDQAAATTRTANGIVTQNSRSPRAECSTTSGSSSGRACVSAAPDSLGQEREPDGEDREDRGRPAEQPAPARQDPQDDGEAGAQGDQHHGRVDHERVQREAGDFHLRRLAAPTRRSGPRLAARMPSTRTGVVGHSL